MLYEVITINFQLIALPMSELVPAGARIGGVPVATISALVIVLMETALGIFVMDMLEITDLFPKLATASVGRTADGGGVRRWSVAIIVTAIRTTAMIPGAHPRITSYNVCYTKLLRFPTSI